MSLQATSNSYYQTLTLDPPITTNGLIRFDAWGMKPNTKYDIFVNDVDYGWATKPWGKNLGDQIVSDSNGKAVFFILTEIPFEASYAYDRVIADNNTVQSRNQQNNQLSSVNLNETVRTIQLIAPGSTITIKTRVIMWITLGHPNRSEHHTH